MKAFSVIALVCMLTLTGCGAGSSDVQVPDYSAAITQAAKDYASTMPKITPPPPINPTLPVVPVPTAAYTSASVIAEGVDMGIIAGTDDVSVIKKITDVIIADPVKYQALYKLLLSAEGMHFTLKGKNAYFPVKFVAKLTNSGLVVGMV